MKIQYKKKCTNILAVSEMTRAHVSLSYPQSLESDLRLESNRQQAIDLETTLLLPIQLMILISLIDQIIS